MTTELAFTVRMQSNFDDALQTVIDALRAQGFGVLTSIDVRATLKEKLDLDFRPYVILGACNPPLAHRALSSDPAIGIMLPCNITVEQTQDDVLVSLANPTTMLSAGSFAQNEELQAVAEEARTRMQNVASQLSN